MANNRKRHRRDQDRRSNQNRDHSRSPDPNHNRVNHQSPKGKQPVFISYIDTPNLPPKVKILCEIIANTPSLELDRSLDDTAIRVSTEDVEDVLKLSYAYPAAAV
ncbi:hypothetical protein HanRHA438_Chr15g0731541 [Helianthus annuus]|uniref:Uncharacterized protein n=1 Tax=Helianthus annuus TaxID=4232 RepID=A0A9K3E4M4_HELAN|nr:hypothetical protein HanXRQr2_Chr15g0719211 [Helianthus annuus]KAJ0453100.1 hypothetical protein HanHA300_Chr15g0586551 [Helianthus annuus]KAJ0475012.1 hypothetical protein HanHA89_Chr15g0636311 [Helianthus annuus]KAJ0650567.1 hypothetical protein HanLR1_Chr15g0597221 [Helianthus annuus]KAJ0654321.1 hypothetical protein HanOQP8_Chr15g0593651 [Helianthus annuus]